MVNPEVVCHPSMAMTTAMQANSLPPFWYGSFSPHHTKPIENKGNNKITELRTILQRESQNS
jgi:hypothetical protein